MKKKLLSIIAVIAIIVLFFCIKDEKIENKTIEENINCNISEQEVIVRGYSMSPFLNSGEDVDALFGYYDCSPIQRNDIVLYDYSGNNNLLVKFVKAMPGDRWNLKEIDGSYEIEVNGISLVNSEGRAYLIGEGSVDMLKLYIKDYPVIPENTYLLLGDEVKGSFDSTRFGLVGKKDIVAKVEKRRQPE
jgi:signal peptidase I